MPDDQRPGALIGPTTYNFDRVAAEYEATRYLPTEVADDIAACLVDTLPEHSWYLDAGIGTGRIGRPLMRRHRRTVGIDISSGMLGELCKTVDVDNLNLCLADIRALPFSSGAFGGVLTTHVLHLIEDWPAALRELWRVIEPGGSLTVARESRTSYPTSARFFALAGERASLGTSHGRATGAEVAELLRTWTPVVEERRPLSTRWLAEVTVADLLRRLRMRTYSSTWAIDDTEFEELIAQTESWARAEYETRDWASVTEHRDCQVVLLTADKPKER